MKAGYLAAICVQSMLTQIAMCAESVAPATMSAQEVAHLKQSNAEADAVSALSHGDQRLLAVYGITLELPGVDDDTGRLKEAHGVRVLNGTSDAYKNDNERRLNENARQYAATYNRVVLRKTDGKK